MGIVDRIYREQSCDYPGCTAHDGPRSMERPSPLIPGFGYVQIARGFIVDERSGSGFERKLFCAQHTKLLDDVLLGFGFQERRP